MLVRARDDSCLRHGFVRGTWSAQSHTVETVALKFEFNWPSTTRHVCTFREDQAGEEGGDITYKYYCSKYGVLQSIVDASSGTHT